MKHQEARVSVGPEDFKVTAGYIALSKSPDDDSKRKYSTLGLSFKFAQYWTANVGAAYDLEKDNILGVRGGIDYLDECFGLSLSVSYALNSGTVDDDYSGLTTYFQISFKNLGGVKSGS
jgi:lipopolysaccharide assembly outer membrane protein LptD (OstA)